MKKKVVRDVLMGMIRRVDAAWILGVSLNASYFVRNFYGLKVWSYDPSENDLTICVINDFIRPTHI